MLLNVWVAVVVTNSPLELGKLNVLEAFILERENEIGLLLEFFMKKLVSITFIVDNKLVSPVFWYSILKGFYLSLFYFLILDALFYFPL